MCVRVVECVVCSRVYCVLCMVQCLCMYCTYCDHLRMHAALPMYICDYMYVFSVFVWSDVYVCGVCDAVCVCACVGELLYYVHTTVAMSSVTISCRA